MRSFIMIFLISSLVSCRSYHNTSSQDQNKQHWIESETQLFSAETKNMNPAVLKLSLTAYQNARLKGLDEKQLLTIIDYSKPSNEARLWVLDLKTNKVLFNMPVAHGKNSGGLYANAFSNNPRSLKSSLGVFVTDASYSGGHGSSLRIKGLEKGFNDNAYRRDVVFHGAWYAGEDVAKRGALGRSWGCMAVGENQINSLVNTIKDKTIVVAYYPDPSWLAGSSFLQTQQA